MDAFVKITMPVKDRPLLEKILLTCKSQYKVLSYSPLYCVAFQNIDLKTMCIARTQFLRY